MALIITPQNKIDAYFASEALSQSKLKSLLSGPHAFKSIKENEFYYEEKNHFIIGSAVDCILTSEEGQFEKLYYVSQIDKKPGDALLSITNQVFDLVVDFYNHQKTSIETPSDYSFEAFIADNGEDLKRYEEYVLCAMNSQEYCLKMTDKVRFERVYVTNDYFKDLCRSFGKQILSVEEKTVIDNIVSSLKTSENTRNYFDRNSLENDKEVDVYYQLPIYFFTKIGDIDIPCKALLDIVIVIKHEGTNEITQIIPIDLKTMSGYSINFLGSLKSYRYDIQAVWYTRAISFFFGTDNIENYRFVVESSTKPGNPIVYQIQGDIMEIGLNGRKPLRLIDTDFFKDKDTIFPDVMLSYPIKGIKQLLEDYLYYEENGYEVEKVVKENNGVLKINWNEIEQ